MTSSHAILTWLIAVDVITCDHVTNYSIAAVNFHINYFCRTTEHVRRSDSAGAGRCYWRRPHRPHRKRHHVTCTVARPARRYQQLQVRKRYIQSANTRLSLYYTYCRTAHHPSNNYSITCVVSLPSSGGFMIAYYFNSTLAWYIFRLQSTALPQFVTNALEHVIQREGAGRLQVLVPRAAQANQL